MPFVPKKPRTADEANKLSIVASMMDNHLRTENYAQSCLLAAQQRTIHDLIGQIEILKVQARELRHELHDSDGIIFDVNVRNWDLTEQVDILLEQNAHLRRANADLDYQLNGSVVSDDATTILESSSDTESEDLFSTHEETDV